MDKEIPWIKFSFNDFMNDEKVCLMCDEAIGLYIRILAYSWKHESIPKEHEKIIRIFGLTKHKFKKLWVELEPCFFEKNSRLYQKRLLEELSEAKNYFQQKSDSGSKGAEVTWQRYRQRQESANGESMLDLDLDTQTEEVIKPSKPSDSQGSKTRPLKTKKQEISKGGGFAVANAVTSHKDALDIQCGDTSPRVRKLHEALLCVSEVASEPERLLAFILQARRAEIVDSRVGYCITIIKDPKFQVADKCLTDAKRIIRDWHGTEIVAKVQKIIPNKKV